MAELAIALAGQDRKGVVVCPISFVSEHIETLVELDHEYAELAVAAGTAPYIRVPALGVQADFIRGLARLVKAALDQGTTGTVQPGSSWRCGDEHGRCPCLEETV